MTTTPPPILPSPHGWRQPTTWTPPSGRLHLAGLVVSAVGAWGALTLLAHAWQACDDIAAGTRAGMVVVVFPLMAFGMWVAFFVGIYITWSRTAVVRFLAGSLLAFAAIFLFVTAVVPDPATPHHPGVGYPECGPYGIPTWWPTWLPS